ncbi:Rieske 2Fe-2S domain-containing protein [Desertivirga brevis]|uniref:Rieske 2Fe-2S domain-containing protein n=1 Tax=Desertivirga brevis TaxID=2810310 RepID=UPI001A95FA3E|nr:Rieske 2Fe-2S domain-containing protein [Pedobacter sp. SYSU D00873]
MERDEFLKSLGIGLALVCTGSCFTACKKGGAGEEEESNNGIGSTASVDINTLTSVGSSREVNGVLFFRIAASNEESSFIATQPTCPHQNLKQLIWNQSQSRVVCTAHGSSFSSTGALINGPATSSLKIYGTTLSGTTLTAIKS